MRRGVISVAAGSGPSSLRRHERPAYLMDWGRYRERNRIERLMNRLKQHRRIATRYEKRAATFAAFVTLVSIRLWV